MTITSGGFQQGEYLPKQYTCDGEDINPALTFSEVPKDAGSLVLIMDDPDSPSGTFTHWLLYNMSPATLQILENATPETGTEGTNDFQRIGYGGACPHNGTHRYFFRLYALKSMLDLPEGATRQQLDAAMQGQVIDTTELMGRYERVII